MVRVEHICTDSTVSVPVLQMFSDVVLPAVLIMFVAESNENLKSTAYIRIVSDVFSRRVAQPLND